MRIRREPARRRRAAAPAMRGSGERGWGAAGPIVTVRETVVGVLRGRWVVRALRERWVVLTVRGRWVVPATEAWTRTG
jgi:hypothetical protein